MSIRFNKYLLITSLILFCANVFAQKDPPPPGPPPPPGLPIDNWVPFFIGIGIAYAVYVLKFKAKKQIN